MDPSAGDGKVPAGGGRLLPEHLPAEVAGALLDSAERPTRFTQDDIWEYLDGGAHEILRLGFEQLVVARYKEAGSETRVVIEAYTMKSSEAARSLLEAWRSERARTSAVCGQALLEGSLLCWQQGNRYVRLIAISGQENAGVLLENLGRDLCPVLSPP
jgi:hypothetical protein